MRYVKARYTEYQRELAYRFYISDAFFYQGQNKAHAKKFYEIINPQPEETRTGDEIVADLTARLKGNKNEHI